MPNVLYQNLFFGAGASRSWGFMEEAGDDFFLTGAGAQKKYRYLVPELMPNGSAPQYWKNFYE